MEKVLRWLSRAVPEGEREDWVREWQAEWAHGRQEGRSAVTLASSATEDCIRLRLRSWTPGPLTQDLRFAVRSLRRNPAYAAVAVVTLGLGLGANTAIYSVVNATMVRPLPIEEPDRIVVATKSRLDRRGPTSAPNFLDWREQTESLEGLSALQPWPATLTGAGRPLRVTRDRVSADIFETLRVDAALGRTFRPGEDQIGAEAVAVLSHDLWSTAFGSDREVLGRRVEVNGEPLTVIGVLPAGFALPPFTAQIYVPWAFQPDALAARGRNNVWAIGRLASGWSLSQARQEMAGIGDRLADEYPDANEGWSIDVEPIHDFALGSSPESLGLLLGAVGLLLLIACANVANLTLARGVVRRSELAVRVSLGAGRARLVRQMWAETLVVAFLGGAVGMAVAWASVGPIQSLLPSQLASIGAVTVDFGVLAFAFVLALLTGTVAGLLPAVRMAREAASGGGVASSLRVRGDGGRLRRGLAAGQFALAMTLLVGAGLLLRSLSALYAVDLGMDPAGLTSFYVTLPAADYTSPEAAIAGIDGIVAGLEELPEVRQAASVSHLPLTASRLSSSLVLEGHEVDHTVNAPSAAIRVASPGYFELLSIPVVEGRAFNVDDRPESLPVAMINETAARMWWPGESPVGRWLWYANDANDEPIRRTIVGVVADVRWAGPGAPAMAEVYQPHGQTTELFRWFGQSMYFVAHTGSTPLEASAVLSVLEGVDPDLPPDRLSSMEANLDRTVATPRIHGTLIGAFALLALALAAVGLYGVMAFTVRQRTREIGLRLAIGAGESRILKHTLRQALETAAAGTVLGGVASLVLGRFFSSALFDVRPEDPVTYVGVTAILVAVTLAASVTPALRAARTDPAIALRSEA